MAISFRDRNVQLIVGGGLFLVLVVAMFLVLGGSGGGGTPSALGSPGPASGFTGASQSPSPSVSPSQILLFSGRDPFAHEFSSPSPSATPTPTSSPTDSPTPTVSPAGSPSEGPSGGSSTVVAGHTVVLIDIFRNTNGTRMAQVEVDGTVYTRASGETFDDNFKLVSFASADCANFLYVEDAFTLCQTANK